MGRSSIPSKRAYFDDRQNRLRDVVGDPVTIAPKPLKPGRAYWGGPIWTIASAIFEMWLESLRPSGPVVQCLPAEPFPMLVRLT